MKLSVFVMDWKMCWKKKFFDWVKSSDIEKGFEYLTLALNQNHPETEFCLGLLYLQGRFIKKH